MIARTEIVEYASNLMKRKLRFRPYGRNPDYGMDCIGIVIWIGKKAGAIAEDAVIPCYSFPPSTENFEHLTEFLDPAEKIEPGTIIVFLNDKTPAHVGIVTHKRDEKWILAGSIPGTLQFGQFPLVPSISENIWRMFDYRNVE